MSQSDIHIPVTGDITPIAKGVQTNLDALPKGTNKLFDTFFGKKHAESWRYQMLVAAQTNHDVNLVSTGKARFEKGEINLLDNESDSTQRSLSGLIKDKHDEELNNLVSCMKEAIKDSINRTDTSDDNNISTKFFSRWRNEAIHISEKEEQEIWGKVLSEENQKQGSFSLFTLDILRNLDKRTAALFNEICNYIIFEDLCILNDNNEISERITSKELFKLTDIGLLKASPTPIRTSTKLPTITIDGKENYFADIHPYLVFFEKNNEDTSVLYTKLTTSGQELYRIARHITENTARNLCTYLLNMKSFSSINKIYYTEYKTPMTTNSYTFISVKDVLRPE